MQIKTIEVGVHHGEQFAKQHLFICSLAFASHVHSFFCSCHVMCFCCDRRCLSIYIYYVFLSACPSSSMLSMQWLPHSVFTFTSLFSLQMRNRIFFSFCFCFPFAMNQESTLNSPKYCFVSLIACKILLFFCLSLSLSLFPKQTMFAAFCYAHERN